MALSLATPSCGDDDNFPTTPPGVTLLPFIVVPKTTTFSKTVEDLETTLARESFVIPEFSPIAHDVAASNVDLELNPTRVYIFGNPAAGTKLMQEDQRIGLDLPLKIMAYETASKENGLGFYTASTIAERYTINNQDNRVLLRRIDSTLLAITGFDLSVPSRVITSQTPAPKGKVSTLDLETTLEKVKAAILENGFNLVGEVAHDIAAENIGETLNPTRLLIFGNPKGGTRLMQQDQRTGIDLPLKILIYEDDNGVVRLAYNDSDFFNSRYQLNATTTVLDNVDAALETITEAGIK